MNIRTKKNILIIALTICIVFMSVGYALLSAEMNDNNKEKKLWGVEITNIIGSATTGSGESLGASMNGTIANFNSKLAGAGDGVTYTVSVTNTGAINAVLRSISVNPEDYDVDNFVVYSIDGINSGDYLKAGETINFTVKASYNEMKEIPTEEELIRSISVTLNYVQY